jgi:NAD(P)-dependent dehydrogenase (short-subunit alcohol dehydrogenase family)
MSAEFAGKVVIVAGGTGGLGRTVTLKFLAEGARVAVPWHVAEEWTALVSEAAGTADRLTGEKIDVTDPEQTRKFVADLTANWGCLDILVNTVGGYAGGIKLWEMTAETLDRMLNLNVRTGFAMARAAVPAMLAKRSGAIVNVAAKAAWDHAAGASAYAASKAAALAMMDSLAADLQGSGVRVNSILPSIIDTPANRHAMPGADFSKWPTPDEIARVILFLSSPAASVIHGAAIPVFGNK